MKTAVMVASGALAAVVYLAIPVAPVPVAIATSIDRWPAASATSTAQLDEIMASETLVLTDEQLAALKALQEACGGICANSAKITDGIARIEAAIVAGQQRHKQLPAVFSNILAASKELGGHAELTQVEVREKL